MAEEAVAAPASADSRARRGRGGRSRRGSDRRYSDSRSSGQHAPMAPRHHAPPPPPPRPAVADDDGPVHTAPHDELIEVVRDMMTTSPNGVTLDQLANALRERGFRRTPGSPRLITRLKRIKQLDINRNGLIRVMDEDTPPARHAAPEPVEPQDADEPLDIEPPTDEDEADEAEDAGDAAEAAPSEATAEGAQRRRRRRRGGRRRRGRRGGSNGSSSNDGENGGEVIAAAPSTSDY
jgi:hypothetical protein